MSVSKIIRGEAKVSFGERSCTEQENGIIHPLSELGNLFVWKTLGFGNYKKLSVDKMENKYLGVRVNKTYFCRETEEKFW